VIKFKKVVMKLKLFAAVIISAILLPFSTLAQTARNDDFRQALDLYEHGMFERAESIFSQIYTDTGSEDALGYRALCSVRLQEVGYESVASEFITNHPYSRLVPQVHFYNGLNLFDDQNYQEALNEFSQIDTKDLETSQIPEYQFKYAYSKFGIDDYAGAKAEFEKVENMPMSDYTAPSRYILGYINYSEKHFKQAYDWFEKSEKDPRFEELSQYYKVECRFMMKDYDYVIKNGVAMMKDAPSNRKSHLARIVSESYLAKGDSDEAKRYYDMIGQSSRDMDRDDYFYAGSLYYAMGDYKSAIDNYSLMKERTDSIGQIANYELGYSYIQTGNKVAAMDSFKAASEYSYDPKIQEDAHFNYAKLSFDLNHNPSVFDEYIAKYGNDKGDQIYSYMALSRLYNHDYSGAVEAYSHIDQLDSDQKANYMKANYLRAQQLISGGSWKDAIPLLKAASFYSDKHDGFNQLARYWLGESQFRSEQYPAAAETFKELYNISALDGQKEGNLLPYNIGWSYFKNKDYANAAKWFDQYLATRNPEMGEDAALRRADCDFVNKDYAKAIKEYEDAASRFAYSDNLYPYLQSGIAYGLSGKNDKKIASLSKALTAKPEAQYYAETMYELGRAYVAGGKTDDAVSCFEKLRQNTNDKTISARTLIELGMIARNKSDNDKALGYYKQVVEEMPGTEYAQDALLAIESIYQSQGRADEYLDYADKVGANFGKTESEKDDMYFAAAEQVFMTENYEKASQSLQNYMSRYPNGKNIAKADYYMAECERNLGKKEQACDWYAKAIEADPNATYSEMALLHSAQLNYEMEHFKDAYRNYASLVQKTSNADMTRAARLGLMRSAYKAQDWSTAISQAEKVKALKSVSADETREADYICAESYLSTNERDKAFAIFRKLSAKPATDEGAEATYMLIQDAYDQGQYESVESKVYKFAKDAPDQSYWLAKAYITLGDSFAERDDYKQARATFESIRDGYKPEKGTSDDVLDNVRMRLEKLNNIESGNE
jgi:tetratricopeptide (TPR) repeat protein